MHSDPIADMLTRIRNGGRAHLTQVDMPASGVKQSLAKILQDEGLITSFELVKDTKFPTLRVQLKYFQDKKHAIRIIRRISKPGLRVYSSSEKLRPVRNGLATQVVSTSQGIMTDRDARRRHIGGEVMFEVW